MIRRILYLLLVTVLLGGLAGAIAFYAFDFKPKMLATVILGAPRPPETISAEPARTDTWQPQIAAIGSVTAFQGIDITPKVGGIVNEINFESGQDVNKGQLLVKLDTETEEADMRSIVAEITNNDTELKRREGLVSKGVVAVTELDSLKTKQRVLQATLDRRRAEVAQKFIYAPWAGRVGLRDIAVGSYIAPGQKIVWLQQIDPIYVDFSVTESDYARIKEGQTVNVSLNAYPDQSFTGKIVTTDARLSDTNRMIMVRAEIDNPDKKLVPGMYANVLVDVGEPEKVVTVPQTAVTYSLYGDNIFVVNATKVKDKDGKDVDELVVERRFVKAGPVRDGRVSIISGIKDGDKVVTAGQNKIDQGSKVKIDNSIALKLQDTTTIQ
ncbi:efflux transporter periplasmic adaptor subunit [Aestuariivirga litoralis]|uniref:Efflux transporter periplasmic adaptor subunit n=1 Tax=Aestuariivirga litoralis TaxID=2650924 RepID=A0A2W2APE1_9HYPH|nr:efflux RND transporter periplasmic adaptor subunit [Aestuariivirga litoralis]PZF75452.1 efflux transporter periplasmic adaptor subunit [Aestuariivirga litoralis]